MPANLRRVSRLLPTRAIPALLGFLVLMGCDVVESDCGQEYFGKGAKYNAKLDIIEVPPSDPPGLKEILAYYDSPFYKQFLKTLNEQLLSTPVTPVDQTTANPPGSGGSFSHLVRRAASATSIVYVLDKFGGLLRFDPVAAKFVATLDFSQLISQVIAQRFAVTPDYKFAFITANSANAANSAGYVLVADLASFSIVSTINLPAGMLGSGIAITPDGALAYVVARPLSGTGPSNVYVINVATRQITTTIPVTGFSGLGQIAIAPDGTVAYLANNIAESGFSIPVLDLLTNTVQPAIPVFPFYTQSYMTLHPDGTRIYLAPILPGPVMVVSTVTGLTSTITLPQGTQPAFGSGPVFTPDGIHLVFTSGSTSVVFVNTIRDTVESTIPLPAIASGGAPNICMFFVPNT